MPAEIMRKCFICLRSPAVDPDIKLFRFPKPGVTNAMRCEQWAKFCFPDKDWSSPDFQNKLYKKHRMLCNKHFKTTFFMDYPLSQKKLHRFAFPSTDESESSKELEVSQKLKEPQELEVSQKVKESQKWEESLKLEEPQVLEVSQKVKESQEWEESLKSEEPQKWEESQEWDESQRLEEPQKWEESQEWDESQRLKEPQEWEESQSNKSYNLEELDTTDDSDNSQILQEPHYKTCISFGSSSLTEREKLLLAKCIKQKKKIHQLRNIINKLKRG